VISLENTQYADTYFLFFVLFFWPAERRYTDTQIGVLPPPPFSPLIIDACLLIKIVFLLSRVSTKIDFCGATGHDNGGWRVVSSRRNKDRINGGSSGRRATETPAVAEEET
jgi:hypothetical protein